jgi:hypothetical protein
MTGGPAAQESFRQAMAQHQDPRIRMIAEWAARQAQQVDDSGPIVDTTAVEEPAVAPQTSSERRRLLRRIRSLTDELSFQQEIGDTLAAALGACYLCWGEDRDCKHCRGRGVPGWASPEPELFDEYIAPAVRRMDKNHNPGADSRSGDWQSSETGAVETGEVNERSS